MDDKKIYITDEEGNEYYLNILFTFEVENKKYVLVYEDDKEDTPYPLIYDDEGNLFIIEDDEEFAMVQDVYTAFLEEDDL